MTPSEVSAIAQSVPTVSTAWSASSQQDDKGLASASASGSSGMDSSYAASVDTVSISDQSRRAITGVIKEDVKKEESSVIENNVKSGGLAAKVQFVYDLKGELSIRYMDTTSKLIYQVPSALMLSLRESVSKLDTSVNTKV